MIIDTETKVLIQGIKFEAGLAGFRRVLTIRDGFANKSKQGQNSNYSKYQFSHTLLLQTISDGETILTKNNDKKPFYVKQADRPPG